MQKIKIQKSRDPEHESEMQKIEIQKGRDPEH